MVACQQRGYSGKRIGGWQNAETKNHKDGLKHQQAAVQCGLVSAGERDSLKFVLPVLPSWQLHNFLRLHGPQYMACGGKSDSRKFQDKSAGSSLPPGWNAETRVTLKAATLSRVPRPRLYPPLMKTQPRLISYQKPLEWTQSFNCQEIKTLTGDVSRDWLPGISTLLISQSKFVSGSCYDGHALGRKWGTDPWLSRDV